jgi:glycosyltransferase involved in cell wall biosynthesis
MRPLNARQVLRRWVKGGAALVRELLPPEPRGTYAVLSTRPVVLLVNDFAVTHPRDAFLDLLRRLGRRPVQVYYLPSWHVGPGDMPRRLRQIRRIELAGPAVRVSVLGLTPAMVDRFTEAGVDAVWCQQNAFADDRIFRPLPDAERRFDALYDARLEPFKRHALAASIPRLALMGYRNPATVQEDYAREIRARFAGTHWFFDPDATPEQWTMTDEDINTAYNQCAVGLCLSAAEGGMWASIQYLLAGLPVVSTPSEGGRDTFFEAPHVRIVAPTPEAVATAVEELIAQRLDPMTIHRRTVALMAPHRARFVEHVDTCFRAAGETRSFATDWGAVIRHRLTAVSLMGPTRRAAIAAYNEAIIAAVTTGAPHLGGQP